MHPLSAEQGKTTNPQTCPLGPPVADSSTMRQSVVLYGLYLRKWVVEVFFFPKEYDIYTRSTIYMLVN